jgi:hypothetical protein
MMRRVIPVALVLVTGAVVIAYVSASAPAARQEQRLGAGEHVARSPAVVQRRGGTLLEFKVGFATRLFGGNEVGQGGRANVGDRDGNGWATIALVGARRLCYSIIVSDIARPVGAHIHRAGPGVVGPVVVPLQPPDSGFGTSSGCVSVSAAVIRAIRSRPAGFYVNVHTTSFRAGAVRGQL